MNIELDLLGLCIARQSWRPRCTIYLTLERAVVIMRNLLRMDWGSVALASDLSQAQAHEAWVHGVFQLNELLHKNLIKEAH